GGGATGLGIAVDAATRGYNVALLESNDFAKATSSRSTKLVHGGVRYLAQGDVGLVLEALHERGLLHKNAPHLVKDQQFIIPCYNWWDAPMYTIGLTMYDILAGKLSLGRSLYKSIKSTVKLLPTIKKKGLKGGVLYHDGQFDDSRLAINLAQTAAENGAAVVNYMQVVSLTKDSNGNICGVNASDMTNDDKYALKAKCVINATGVFVDSILQMDEPKARHIVRPSQGVHIVVNRSFLSGDDAIMIPKTDDGRVLFAVPWHNKVVIGTTDTVREHPQLEPVALEEEVDFILRTAERYTENKILRSEVLSVFAGLRPLAAPKTDGGSTKEISRRHKIIVSASKLITITGGKWTTYRRMAQDTIDEAIKISLLEPSKCVSSTLKIHGHKPTSSFSDWFYVYGSDGDAIKEMIADNPQLGERLHPDYEFLTAEIIWSVRNEMALTIEDILARRLRLLFIDARAAQQVAPKVAEVMALEMGKDKLWIESQLSEFMTISKHFILEDTVS
ncbi:MAG: glycerol-3-phosphate dehydrogenase/oxidase, partial [Rikenellaceae bacterium]